jgi:hypothetical protein
MDGRAARLELSIEVGSDPIQGSVVVDAGAPEPFCGWMELTAAIEAARDQRGPDLAAGGEVDKSLGSGPGANGSEWG